MRTAEARDVKAHQTEEEGRGGERRGPQTDPGPGQTGPETHTAEALQWGLRGEGAGQGADLQREDALLPARHLKCAPGSHQGQTEAWRTIPSTATPV